MTLNPFNSDALRPDQQKWASTQMGVMSPMWLPFIAAAGVGAAWWTMTHWARVMGAGYPGSARSAAPASNGAGASAGAAQAPSAGPSSAAAPAAPMPSAVPLDEVSARSAAVAAPEPAPADVQESQDEQLQASFAEQRVPDALSESLAVQGEDDATDAAAAAAPTMERQAPAVSAPQPAPQGSAQAETGSQTSARAAPSSDQHGDHHGDHEKPEPILPPHEGLPARRKGGGGKKKG